MVRLLANTFQTGFSRVALVLACTLLLAGVATYPISADAQPPGHSQSGKPHSSKPGSQAKKASRMESKRAAEIAKKAVGGKVLRIQRTNSGHRVKLLLPSGKVTYLQVDDNGTVHR